MQSIKDILAQSAERTGRTTTESLENTNLWSDLPDEPEPPERCICKGTGWYGMPVDLGHPWFGKAFPCVCTLALHGKRHGQWLWSEARLPDKAKHATLQDYDANHPDNAKVKRVAVQFITGDLPTQWLAIIGTYGNGKTHVLTAIIRAFVLRGVHAVYGYVPAMLKELQATIDEKGRGSYAEACRAWQRVPVLALDDLGVEQATDWSRSILEELIDYRYRDELPTVIATNHDLDKLPPRIASRMTDRLLCTLVVNEAPDYRSLRTTPRMVGVAL